DLQSIAVVGHGEHIFHPQSANLVRPRDTQINHLDVTQVSCQISPLQALAKAQLDGILTAPPVEDSLAGPEQLISARGSKLGADVGGNGCPVPVIVSTVRPIRWINTGNRLACAFMVLLGSRTYLQVVDITRCLDEAQLV